MRGLKRLIGEVIWELRRVTVREIEKQEKRTLRRRRRGISKRRFKRPSNHKVRGDSWSLIGDYTFACHG